LRPRAIAAAAGLAATRRGLRLGAPCSDLGLTAGRGCGIARAGRRGGGCRRL